MYTGKYKVGDKVKVVQYVESHTCGWDNSWAEEMDGFIGKIYIITHDCRDMGYRLEGDWYCFPEESLQKVEKQLMLFEI